MPERKFILTHHLAPGDETCTTALVRDIVLTYGDRYAVDFRNTFRAIYECNPYLTPLQDSEAETIKLCYRKGMTTVERGDKHHFITEFHRNFEAQTGIHVDCLQSKTDLHLSTVEKECSPIRGRYWLVFGGGKTDFTVKHWRYSWYQETIDTLQSYGLRFAQSGSAKPDSVHPPMQRVMSLLGWGYIRQLMWQIYHCEGIICPITCAMHMGSAFEKPVVVIAGGREHWAWEAYTNDGQFGPKAAPIRVPHRYLHTIGLLECCKDRGCWRNKVMPHPKDKLICHQRAPQPPGSQPLPACMNLITPATVCEAVMSYYEQGYLPPIGLPQWEVRDWYARNAITAAPHNVFSCPINWDQHWSKS